MAERMAHRTTNEKSPLERGNDSEEKRLLLKREDPSSGPQHPKKQKQTTKTSIVAHARKPKTCGG